ncbi:hypothetical protein L2E82_29608 [Cichorium intybus]|uniref:Uncharacterized protein n=1 Tax=Cichorium intybus TaxID=13427 RepID=A0ACB9CY04_CICIN|nr:hypothetical protein L2E82_29608 [Cichorium intybus]
MSASVGVIDRDKKDGVIEVDSESVVQETVFEASITRARETGDTHAMGADEIQEALKASPMCAEGICHASDATDITITNKKEEGKRTVKESRSCACFSKVVPDFNVECACDNNVDCTCVSKVEHVNIQFEMRKEKDSIGLMLEPDYPNPTGTAYPSPTISPKPSNVLGLYLLVFGGVLRSL